MAEKVLLLETSQKVGTVALAHGDVVLGVRLLEEARRHARDLVPFTRALLDEQGWKARDLNAVFVSRGPGSYTGLRVGIMSAKTLAFAAGCALLAVDTFAALAWQSPPEARLVDVLEDAQQGKVYVERFQKGQSVAPLRIAAFEDWLEEIPSGLWVTGPGLVPHRGRVPEGVRMTGEDAWRPRPESLLALGLPRLRRGERDDVFAVEPLYLRRSQAEEQWRLRHEPEA